MFYRQAGPLWAASEGCARRQIRGRVLNSSQYSPVPSCTLFAGVGKVSTPISNALDESVSVALCSYCNPSILKWYNQPREVSLCGTSFSLSQKMNDGRTAKRNDQGPAVSRSWAKKFTPTWPLLATSAGSLTCRTSDCSFETKCLAACVYLPAQGIWELNETRKIGVVAHTRDLSTCTAETWGWWVQDQNRLPSKLLCLKGKL